MRTLFILLLLATFPLHAEVPPCFPGVMEPNVERMYPYIVVDDQNNCAAVWFCDVGHKWERWSVAGHGDNTDNCAYPYAKAIAAMFMTRDQKVALWTERFINGIELDPVKQAQYQAQDAPARLLARSVPYPDRPPPSGLVTTDTRVYALSIPVNGTPVMVFVGNTTLGVDCDETEKIAGMYRIDRTKAKYPRGALMPRVTWAKCD